MAAFRETGLNWQIVGHQCFTELIQIIQLLCSITPCLHRRIRLDKSR